MTSSFKLSSHSAWNRLNMRQLLTLTGAFVIICLATGCSTMKTDYVSSYLQEIAVNPGSDLGSGSVKEKQALERFKVFYGNLNEASVKQLVPELYAKDAYFNDTLKTVRGRAAIEEYMLETAGNTQLVNAQVLDVAKSGSDYYLRWVMDVRLKNYKKDEVLRSIGITHLRFDEDGKIILHQDYWDSTAGFFEHLPVLGGVLRWIKTKF